MTIIKMEQNMEYIMTLTEDQRIAFMRALARLAGVDGFIDESEKEFIKDVAGAYGISSKRVHEIMSAKNDDEIIEGVKTIKSRKVALELIKEMCILAHADDVLSESETVFIGRVGQALGVELEKIEQISRWIVDRIIWQEEAKIIFEEV